MKNIQINHAQKGFTLIELNRVYGEISALKTSAEEQLMRGQTLSGALTTIGFTESNLIDEAKSGVTGSSGTYTVEATLGENASVAIDGAKIQLIRTPAGAWSCNVKDSSAGGWDDSFIPVGCSNT